MTLRDSASLYKQIKKTVSGKKVCALLLAGGDGRRMGGTPKQHRLLLGIPVIVRAALALQKADSVDGILAVIREGEEALYEEYKAEYRLTKLLGTVTGGKSRLESALRGLRAVPGEYDYIAIHDGARCLTTPEEIDRVVADAAVYRAASAAVRSVDTVKRSYAAGGFTRIKGQPPRSQLFCMQTPQVFDISLYRAAASAAEKSDSAEITDDCSLLEAMGVRCRLTLCSRENLKITTEEDLLFAEAILRRREKEETHMEPSDERKPSAPFRVGHGYDVHRLTQGRALILGGVKIPFEKGLLGHSDADVLTHAVMDALLGAAGLGDIGRHFPDSDPAYAGADSLRLAEKVRELLAREGFVPCNIDATVLAEKPKLAPYIPQMRKKLAAALQMEPGSVSVKATTEEGLGFTGEGEGIAAHAVCLLTRCRPASGEATACVPREG